MLIVNADDFGATAGATDAIVETIDARVVSSASAMVWMPDSERAAKLARERGLRLGLHLNLTLPFQGPDVPGRVVERQLHMTDVFGKESWSSGRVRGAQRQEVEAALQDQLEQFRAQFGEPTHINGHHHVHVADVVLEALPQDIPIRQIPTTPGRLHNSNGRARSIRQRFRAPWATLDITSLHPALGGVGLELLGEPAPGPIEIVTHPQQAAQKAALLDSKWREAVLSAGLGTYTDLS